MKIIAIENRNVERTRLACPVRRLAESSTEYPAE